MRIRFLNLACSESRYVISSQASVYFPRAAVNNCLISGAFCIALGSSTGYWTGKQNLSSLRGARFSPSADQLRSQANATALTRNLRNGDIGRVGGDACDPGSVDTLHNVVVILPGLHRSVHIGGLGDGRRIQLLVRRGAAR